MRSKTVILIAAAAILAAVYLYFFTDLVKRPRIQIISQIRPAIPSPSNPNVCTVAFTFDGKYPLTSLKVLRVEARSVKRSGAPLWHLVTSSNSVPVHGLVYGIAIAGMRAADTNRPPQPLEPGVTYRLLVESGKLKGEKDFRTRALTAP